MLKDPAIVGFLTVLLGIIIAIAIIVAILDGFKRFKRLKAELDETRRKLIASHALHNLLQAAASPNSINIEESLEKFWALVPAMELSRVELHNFRKEIDRVRFQSHARFGLASLRILHRYIKQPSEALGDEVMQIRHRLLALPNESFVGVAEKAIVKLKGNLRIGCWTEENIGTSEREIHEILTDIVRYDGENTRDEAQAALRSLRAGVIRLSEQVGHSFSPLLETVLTKPSIEEEGTAISENKATG